MFLKKTICFLFLTVCSYSIAMENPLLRHVKAGAVAELQSLFSRNESSMHDFINQPGVDGEPPLHWACILGNEEMVKLLVMYGADVNGLDKDNDTPLHSTAIGGNGRIAQVLLDHGARRTMNVADRHGYVALHSAAFHGNFDFLRVLLASGAQESVNHVANDGLTPLGAAIKNGHVGPCCAILRQYGARA